MKNNLNKKFNDISRNQITDLERRLISAAEKGDAAEVVALIKKGVDVFVMGELPQKLAAGNGHLEVVKLLAAEGSVGLTCYGAPGMHAKNNGHKEVVEFLSNVILPLTEYDVRSGRRLTELEKQLFAAAETNNATEVARLIKKDVNVAVSDNRALLLAAKNGHLEVAKLLIAAGAYGFSPIVNAAVNNEHWKVVEFLQPAYFDELRETLQKPRNAWSLPAEDIIKILTKYEASKKNIRGENNPPKP